MTYSDRVASLIATLEEKVQLGIDLNVQMSGRVPNNATSEFLINKEQGDWAERLIHGVVNSQSQKWFAAPYGRQDNLSAGDPGFADFYRKYQDELNDLGKKPDLLVFRRSDFPDLKPDLSDDNVVMRAVAALEVRSSAFLERKYRDFMAERTRKALMRCGELKVKLMEGPLADVLKKRSPIIFDFITSATAESFRDITFRRPSWNSSADLRAISSLLAELQKEIKILQTRDFLSITPKVEDIALVSRWINRFNVPHFYVQVFFDGAFAIPFEQIVSIPTESEKEETCFRIEKDTKNQGKSTIKINVDLARSIVNDIAIPEHKSVMKELARGRLLFFVTFDGASGLLDQHALNGLLDEH
ncbi:MAG TPA: AccI family restriction endonuclease [Rhodanobacteraceae bacterium]